MKKNKSIIKNAILFSLILILLGTNNAYGSERQIINAHVGHYPNTSISVTFQDVAIYGNNAFISDAELPGLRVISLADPSTPSFIAYSSLTAPSYEIEIANNITFIRVLNYQSFDIAYIDISNPLAPVYKGLLDLGHSRGFDASGTTLYVNNGTELISFNFTDINNPIEIDRIDLLESGQSLAVISNYIYTCTSDNVLHIIDATNPTNLSILSSTDLGDFYADSYLINGSILYISGLDSTKTVLPERAHRGYIISVDISNKSDPVFLSDLFIDGINGVGLALLGNKLFVGACAEGIKVIDIDDSLLLKSFGYYDDYQDIYCEGGGDYAIHPKLFVDSTLGNLLIFVSSSCGLNIISVDGLEFEGTIPGYNLVALAMITVIGVFLIYRKFKNQNKIL